MKRDRPGHSNLNFFFIIIKDKTVVALVYFYKLIVYTIFDDKLVIPRYRNKKGLTKLSFIFIFIFWLFIFYLLSCLIKIL